MSFSIYENRFKKKIRLGAPRKYQNMTVKRPILQQLTTKTCKLQCNISIYKFFGESQTTKSIKVFFYELKEVSKKSDFFCVFGQRGQEGGGLVRLGGGIGI